MAYAKTVFQDVSRYRAMPNIGPLPLSDVTILLVEPTAMIEVSDVIILLVEPSAMIEVSDVTTASLHNLLLR